ncbi:restriction endonuclease [Streptomyces griseoloalbus]|uniref:Restriction system protein n=1 Tax=Streptomyces griseoloalbus TaxID=67303 RepID=A0A7W8BTH5_9ACTN|nr:restriction endonuclease [Streptomyces albaduncus]MBB5128592.1 restriction system protein [Streptomyces albaduncus]GGV73052.1 restriction endonuclease [Streptomyces griseoloalbus]GGW47451.1 restriction endonuclease [Streptomyces albaduncus]
MTMPQRRTRPMPRGRRFDLRATAMFFGLLATALIIAGFAVRALAGVAQRRPVWAVVLLCVVAAALLAHGRRRRRLSAARIARRAGEALEQATTEALDALDTPSPAPAPPTARAIDYEALNPEEFEEAIAALCVRDGCSQVQVVGGAGDLGADVVALSPEGRRLVIQCKRYGDDNKVGSQDLQRFGGTCFAVHEADVALVVTTSDFTTPAAEYAEQCGIVCVDRDALLAWSDGRAPEPWAAGTVAPDC